MAMLSDLCAFRGRMLSANTAFDGGKVLAVHSTTWTSPLRLRAVLKLVPGGLLSISPSGSKRSCIPNQQAEPCNAPIDVVSSQELTRHPRLVVQLVRRAESRVR
eukprot:CAMPEP_0183511734 /NCGR_PEP_ID=MMETSP0371-20130417/11091_1 /TAXON_ID=268820 /ORGANISM="Peridinium aciculiferum, Strain PAER-2" /LENGTH=103 /DNA_ID=CAMNT_0025708697 /DNA_START=158 /DNA_END=467 /DNA_ORIENTATION=-